MNAFYENEMEDALAKAAREMMEQNVRDMNLLVEKMITVTTRDNCIAFDNRSGFPVLNLELDVPDEYFPNLRRPQISGVPPNSTLFLHLSKPLPQGMDITLRLVIADRFAPVEFGHTVESTDD